jgi:multidrug efflux pump subunit AcrB
MGKTAFRAAMDAADEIGLAVVATTMSIVAVFLPVSFMTGLTGQFFKQFGLTVAFAVLMSLGVARLITPLVAAYFLQAHGRASHGEGRLMDLYIRTLQWSLRNRWKTVIAGASSLALTMLCFAYLPQQFQPTVNRDDSMVNIELAPGARLEDTRRVADQAAAILNKAPEVATVYEQVGAEDDVRTAALYITLKPAKQRKRTSVEFERAYAPRLQALADARVSFQSQSNGFGRDITVMLAGDDPAKLEDAAKQVLAGLRTIPAARDPRIDGELRRPEIVIKPRFDVAADLGVTTAALSQTIRIATLGDIEQNMAKFSLSDRQIPIRVALAESSRRDLSTIANLPVPTISGGSVPLSVVAKIGFDRGPVKIRRYNQVRRIVVGADLAPGAVTSDATKLIDALPIMQHLPPGVRRVRFGDAEFQQELVVNFSLAVVAGILLVFAVLVLLYRRVLPPFVNLGSLVLAPLGGVLALVMCGLPISMPVYIGLLMLFGIVAKNSILLVDFAIEEMRRGVDRTAAIIEAGHKRAQPIVMTTVAMVAGMLPIALGLSGDSSWRAPMAITVIGGLILSTLLTLVIVPAGFTLADDLEKWLAPRFGKLLTNQDQPVPARPAPAE